MFVNDQAKVPCIDPFETDTEHGRIRVEHYCFTITNEIGQWLIQGPKLNKDGSEHAGGHRASRWITEEEVPGYVKDEAVAQYISMRDHLYSTLDRWAGMASRKVARGQ